MNKSALITLPLLAFFILLPASTSTYAQASPNHAAMMPSFNLSSQKWKNRVLLVFAPSSNNPGYQQQMQKFQGHKSAFVERDLILVEVLTDGNSYAESQQIDPSSAARLRDRLQVGAQDFRVILVGKDGGVKRRQTTPVQAKAIFEQIDAMPMRQQEMQKRGS